jgi:dihydrofolate reductase
MDKRNDTKMPIDAPRGLTAVVAMTPSGVIGRDGDMPWRLSSDLKRFKKLTLGGTLIMGRKTFDSIGRPLPGRRTIVITRDPAWSAEGTQTANSPSGALEMAESERCFVVGGAEIYRQLLPHCDQILLTRVLSQVSGDTHLQLDLTGFSLIQQIRVPASPKDDVPTEFLRYCRS